MNKIISSALTLLAFTATMAEAAQAKMPAQPSIPNPSARWGVKDGCDFFLTAEALVFRMTQDTIPFAYAEDINTNIIDYHAEAAWKWGFRLAAGYNMRHDCWDFVATYSRFNFSTEKYVTPPVGGTLYSYFNADTFASGSNFSFAKDSWHVDFNLLDVEAGRQYFVSQFLRVRPKIGFRNLWLDNTQKISAQETDSSVVSSMKQQERFWGMGVLAGIDTVWGLTRGFSIYGNFGMSALLGYFNPKLTESFSATGATLETHRDSSGHQENTKGILDLALGLRWDRSFGSDRYHIGFNFGFEQHVFFNMSRMWFGDVNYSNNNGCSGRDFTMSGFTLGGRFDF